jgi:predicted ATPase
MMPFFLARLAEVYGISGQWEEALARLDEAAHLVQTTQERWTDADRHRMSGALLLPMNDPAPAEESYRQALAAAREQNAKFWELRAATSLARLWRDQGKRTEARDLLAPVYGWFTEGFDTRDLKEAKGLLDELSL